MNGESNLGLQRGTVQVVAYDPRWPVLARAEADRIGTLVQKAGLAPLVFEHIGSTAVAGLVAKPIVDLMAGYTAGTEQGPYLELLTSAGYEQRGPQGVPERELCVLGPSTARTHHINLVAVGGLFWRDHLFFRDRLRQEPSLAAAYALLKQDLAARHPTNRGAYTAGKEAFVRRVTKCRPLSPGSS